jgi:Fe-S cluster assembly protein SufD
VSWLNTLRAEAREEFDRKGLPTSRDEQWKYTRVTGLEKQIFEVSSCATVSNIEYGENDIVFLNGTCVKNDFLSLKDNPENFKPYLGKIADYRERVFDALNMALMQDGYFIHIPAGKIIDKPIQILFLTTEENNNKSAYMRNIILMGEHSYATVIERYQGVGNYFNNIVTEISIGACAHLEHYKIQQESLDATHIAAMVVQQSSDSRFISHSVSLGGNLVRNDINTELIAENTECELNGLYLGNHKQHVDYHTLIDHIKPHGTSRQHYKGIVNGRARAVFNGKIVVHPDAQKTNAKMTNKNLLLSKTAEIDTKPELQIDADDVQCSHGATVGQLSAESLFYLKSRGLDDATARHLLTYAFAKEIINRMTYEPVKLDVQKALMDYLTGFVGQGTPLEVF